MPDSKTGLSGTELPGLFPYAHRCPAQWSSFSVCLMGSDSLSPSLRGQRVAPTPQGGVGIYGADPALRGRRTIRLSHYHLIGASQLEHEWQVSRAF
jgi:hypothetical protein